MKKIVILFVFIFATVAMTSCKSSKGCGLTGDVNTPTSNSIESVSTQVTAIA